MACHEADGVVSQAISRTVQRVFEKNPVNAINRRFDRIFLDFLGPIPTLLLLGISTFALKIEVPPVQTAAGLGVVVSTLGLLKITTNLKI